MILPKFHPLDLNHISKPAHDSSLQWPPSVPLQHRKKKETAPFTISKTPSHQSQASTKKAIVSTNELKKTSTCVWGEAYHGEKTKNNETNLKKQSKY